MVNTVAYEVSLWPLKFDVGAGPFNAVLAALIVIVALIASLDGMTIAFRGIRDSITSYKRNGGTPNILTRFVSTVVAVLLFLTGAAFIIGIAAWICGATSLLRRKAQPVTSRDSSDESAND